MPPFLQPLRDALGTVRLGEDEPEAKILFRLDGLDEEAWVVELGREGSCLREASPSDAADLVVFCDGRQMRALIEDGFSEREPRWSGRRELLRRFPTSRSA